MDHDYNKFQIKELKKFFKEKLEIHDLSNLISKNFDKAFIGKVNKQAIIFKDILQWKSHLKELLKIEKKIFVLNCIDLYNLKSFLIFYYLSKYKFEIIEQNSAEVYEYIRSRTVCLKVLSFINFFFFNRTRLYFIIKQFIFLKLIIFLKFKKVYVTTVGSVGKTNVKPRFNNSIKIKYIDYHSADYNNYIISKKKFKLNCNKNFVVFLDSKTPAFIGDRSLFGFKIKYNKIKWYNDLNYFLDKIEKIFRTKIIIVPHPSVRHLENTYYNKRFTVSKDANSANKLISNCRFVISINPTTAVSYCVLYYRPIVFIYNNQMLEHNIDNFMEMKNLSKILSVQLLNINTNFSKKDFLFRVDRKKYLIYKYNFLTSKKIKNVNNLDILKKIML